MQTDQSNQTQNRATNPHPCLCVDLDGTLIRSNSLFEVSWALLRLDHSLIWKLPYWLLGGQAALWRNLASRVDIDPSLWPRRLEVEAFVRQEQKTREVFLVTGAHISIATRFADFFQGFSGAYGTDTHHLTGEQKAAFLQNRFGAGNFDYLGDSRDDLPVWKMARKGYLALPDRSILKACAEEGRELIVLAGEQQSPLRLFLKSLRVHQWSKSLLVFLPAVMGHQLGDPAILMQSLLQSSRQSFYALDFYSGSCYRVMSVSLSG